jgi:hypothetical protein
MRGAAPQAASAYVALFCTRDFWLVVAAAVNLSARPDRHGRTVVDQEETIR